MTTTPVVDPARGFNTWHKREIYDGPNNPGKYVPNVDDLVIDWDPMSFYRVIAVDHYKTNMSMLARQNPFGSGGVTDDDISIITSVGANSNAFRIYVDTSVTPHTMSIDSRLLWNGSANNHVKVFRGTDISATTGVVISAMVNAAGNITSENIPLETAIVPNGTNVTQKTPRLAHCAETVTDGEIAMIVAYDASGRITSVDKFVIVVTNFVRTTNQASKYVSSIELLSPFLSKTDKRLIECPINMVTQSLSLTAKVTYTDGTSATFPVDGTKFSLAGFKTYIASQIGQTVDLVLVYNLSSGELALESTPALPDRKITKDYRLRTTELNTFYDVKMFVVPEWQTNRYVLKFYLYSLERKTVTDVTAYVEYGVGDPIFDGTKYGIVQNLNIAFNMKNLGASYSYFRQTQNLSVSLNAPGTSVGVNAYYTIGYSESTLYGERVKAIYANDTLNAGKRQLDLSCGYTDPTTWVQRLYRTVEPLYYPASEAEAPAPTHARVYINNVFAVEVSINDITSPIRNLSNVITQGGSIRVELVFRETNVMYQLACLPMVATAS